MGSFLETFAGPSHDQPERPLGEMAPHTYVIACAPRTGSTLLADGLLGSGQLGVALEYLDVHGLMKLLAPRWGVPADDVAAYVLQLHRHRTTPDGWLGIKAHWYQVTHFLNMVNGVAPRTHVEPEIGVTAVELLFPNTRWIRLRREDRAAQAVSWFRATRTGSTVRMQGAGSRAIEEPATADQLQEMVTYARHLADMDRAWDEALRERPVTDVTYEELDEDLGGTVDRVRRDLGLGPGLAPEPSIARQRDEWNVTTADRLRELL